MKRKAIVFAFPGRRHSAFTLFEVILALAILVLLSGAVFFMTSATLEATKSTREEQVAARRLEGFLRVIRDTFLSLDARGAVFLRMEESGGATAELVFQKTAGAFGVPSLAGGSLVLAALPQADGSRTFALRRLPKDEGGDGSADQTAFPWVNLMPRVERVRWAFFSNGEWTQEWAQGRGRPELVRLSFDCRDLPGPPVGAIFWVPPVTATSPETPGPSPAARS